MDFTVNGYITNKEEWVDMAQRWSGSEIAKEFEISVPHVYKVMRRLEIKKTFIQPKRKKEAV